MMNFDCSRIIPFLKRACSCQYTNNLSIDCLSNISHLDALEGSNDYYNLDLFS